MADGSLQAGAETHGSPRLCDVKWGARLIARCRCGCEAEIDPAPWLAQGLGSARLTHLEARLRCACGARRAELQRLWTGVRRPRGGIWVFR
jgi:hypothetical protein